jgi:hypothetical protein
MWSMQHYTQTVTTQHESFTCINFKTFPIWLFLYNWAIKQLLLVINGRGASCNVNPISSLFILLLPLWSRGHRWNVLFHFSFLILRQSVGLLGGGIGLSPTQDTGQHKQNKRTQASIPWMGFEPIIPVFERVKTVHVLDRAATLIGWIPWIWSKCNVLTAQSAECRDVVQVQKLKTEDFMKFCLVNAMAYLRGWS